MDQDTAVVEGDAALKVQGRKRLPRGKVRVFGHWCKGCGLCMAFCPQKVFEPNADGHPSVAHPERCTACDWCATHCPDFAITVTHLGDQEGGGQQ